MPAQAVQAEELRHRYLELSERYSVLQEHNRWLSDLGDTAVEMLRQDSVDTLLQHIANELVSVSCANGAYMHMVHETCDYLEVVAACGPLSEELLHERRYKGVGLSAVAWQSGEMQFAEDYNSHPSCLLEIPETFQAVAIPLSFTGVIQGVVFVTANIHEPLFDSLDFLKKIANVASLSIHQAKQRESATLELQRSQRLSELSAMMYQCHDWDQLTDRVCTELFGIFDLKRVSLYQVDESSNPLVSVGTWEKTAEKISKIRALSHALVKDSISNWSCKHNKPAYIERKSDDPRESQTVHAFRYAKGLGSTLCVPVIADGKPWGLLTISRDVCKRNFDENDTNLLHTVVAQMSTVRQRYDLLLRIEHQAYHDSLTHLPNRRHLESTLTTLLTETQEAGKFKAVLFFDLDGFKTVNDTLGHSVGDSLLVMIASQLKGKLRESDFIARLGGDEFAVVLDNLDDKNEALEMSARLSSIFDTTFNVGNREFDLKTSIGISFFPDDGVNVEALIKHADIAMYQAKRTGGDGVVCFDQRLADDQLEQVQFESDLKSAVAACEFELWFQPQVTVSTGRVCGVEALLRWNHPVRGMVSPAEFIPLAEKLGDIGELGTWVLSECIRQASAWPMVKEEAWQIGINVAAPQLIDKQFANQALAVLEQHGFSASNLQLEVTESVLMEDMHSVLENLNRLRQAGVRIALDDFGTGYSSLSYLQDLPLDVLKIDRAFVQQLEAASLDDSLIKTITLLARRFGLETVAEGVETDEQLELVRHLGCDVIQGYYYSKPLPVAELQEAVDAINRNACVGVLQSYR